MSAKNIVKLKLLMKLNKPTINGRTYESRFYKKTLKKRLATGHPLMFGFFRADKEPVGESILEKILSMTVMDNDDALGTLVSYNKGVYEIELFDTPLANEWFMSTDRTKYLLPCVVGNVHKGGLVDDYSICYFYPATVEDVVKYRGLGYKV